MKLKINGTSYSIPLSFTDIEVGRYTTMLQYVENQSEEVVNALTKGEELPEDKEVDFLMGWFCRLLSVSYDIAKKVEVFYFYEVWRHTNFILTLPKEAPILEELKGVKTTESLTTLGGVVLLGGAITYEQYMIVNKLSKMVKNDKMSQNIELLKQMLLVLYPIEGQSKEQQKERLKSFDKLTVLELYSGWFFFVKLINGWLNYFQSLMNDQNYPSKESKQVQLIKAKLYENLRALTGLKSLRMNWLRRNVLE